MKHTALLHTEIAKFVGRIILDLMQHHPGIPYECHVHCVVSLPNV